MSNAKSIQEYRMRAIMAQKKLLANKDLEIESLKGKIEEQRKMLKVLNRLYLGEGSYWEKIKFLFIELFKIK